LAEHDNTAALILRPEEHSKCTLWYSQEFSIGIFNRERL